MRGFMETMTRPIFYDWMVAAHQGQTAENWKKPEGLKTAPAYIVRNGPGGAARIPSPANDLYPSWYKPKSGTTTSRTIDRVSNKLATDCTPELAKQNATNANTSSFSVDIFVDGNSSRANTTATDDIHNCSDIKPRVASIITPGECKVGESCTITVTVSQGTYQLTDGARPNFPGTIDLYVNGRKVQSKPAVNLTPVSFTYSPTTSGTLQLRATVVDSVLYSGTSTANLLVQSGISGGPGSGTGSGPPEEDD
jgi:hypothetical protein